MTDRRLKSPRTFCRARPLPDFASDDVLDARPAALSSPVVKLRPGNGHSAAISTQAYEYVPEIDLALAELHRVLRPGGRVVILDTDWSTGPVTLNESLGTA